MGTISTAQVRSFHERLLRDFPWWSSGISWESVDGAAAIRVADLDDASVRQFVRAACGGEAHAAALLMSARNAAPVFELELLVAQLGEAVSPPKTAVVASAMRVGQRWLLTGRFAMIAFSGSWEIGAAGSNAVFGESL